MDIKHVLDMLAKGRVLFFRAFSLSFIVLFLAYFLIPTNYTSTSKVLLSKNFKQGDILFSSAGTDPFYNRDNMESQMSFIESPAIINEVVKELDLRNGQGMILTTEELLKRINISPVWDADIIEIKVSSDKPEESSAIANSVARQYAKWVQRMNKQEIGSVKDYLGSEIDKVKKAQDANDSRLARLGKKSGSLSLSEDIQKKCKRNADAEIEKIRLEVSIGRIKSRGLLGKDEGYAQSLERRLTAIKRSLSRYAEEKNGMRPEERDLYDAVKNKQVYNVIYPLLVNRLNEIKVSEAVKTSPVQIISFASASQRSGKPAIFAGFMLSLLAAFFTSLIAVFIADYADPSLKTPEEVGQILQMRILGTVPFVDISALSHNRPVVIGKLFDTIPAFSKLQQISSLVNAAVKDKKTVVFVAPSEDRSSPFIAAGFAAFLASDGVKTVLVDSQVHKPFQHEIFGLKNIRGFSDICGSGEDIFGCVQKTQSDNLDIITAGSGSRDEKEMFDRKNITEIIDKLACVYDIVVIDSPPVLKNYGAVELLSVVASAILVVPAGVLTKKDVLETMDTVRGNKNKFAGFVFRKDI